MKRRQELATRLETAGCAVRLTGTDWHDAGDLTPPVPPGGGLPLGRKFPSSKASGLPRLAARYIDNGGSKLGEVQITNHGPGDVYDLDVSAEEEEGLMREDDDFPLTRLPSGKSIRVLCHRSRSLGSRHSSQFFVTLTWKTADGTPIEIEEFVSTGA